MEEWEKEYIINHLSQLVEQTIVRQSLLDGLKQRRILSDKDVQDVTKYSTEYEKASILYTLLQTRLHAFQGLADALFSDNQTGAYWLLQQEPLRRGLALKSSSNELLATNTLLFCRVLPQIDQLLDNDNMRILIISTPDLSLSLKRILDVGRVDLFVHDMESRLSKRKLQSLEEETALVVQCERVDVLEGLLRKLEGSTGNLILLTTELIEEAVEKLLIGPKEKPHTMFAKEEITWHDLTPKAQELILEQDIKFQGSVIKLREVPPELVPINEIRGQLVIHLLNQAVPELVKNGVPPLPNYYVPRKISSRMTLSREAFQNARDDVFVVEGIQLYQLSNLTRKHAGAVAAAARSSAQLKTLSAQFIQLEYAQDYEDICRLSENPVHLVSYKSGNDLTWRKSHKSLGVIQKYISDNQKHVEDEDDFVKRCLKSETPICIGDYPGMGKTLLLTRIAEKVMRDSSSSEASVVRFLTLRELIPDIGNQPEVDATFACELIAKSSSSYELGKQIVIKALQSEKIRCHVFLDGYDEVERSQLATVNKLLDCLRKLRNTQIYVTTRPNGIHELEERLITLGFDINPFDDDDQLTFLRGYWNEAGMTAVRNEDKLEEFAKSCLSRLKENTRERERDIAGIPLQCRLLAEVYSQDAQRYSTGRESIHSESPASTMFEMFQIFVELSFGKVEKPTVRDRVRRAHMYYAITLLFPEIEHQFNLSFLENNLTQHDSIILAPGILEISEHDERNPRFTHRAIAEFLVAQFLGEFLGTASQNPLEMTVAHAVLLKVLSTSVWKDYVVNLVASISIGLRPPIWPQIFEYYEISYFLNSFMGIKSVGCTHLEESAHLANICLARELSNIFTAAVACNFSAIACFVTNLDNFNSDQLSWTNLFLLAAKCAGTALVCHLATLAQQKQVVISEIDYPVTIMYNSRFAITPLHVALHSGNYNVALLLLDTCGFHELLAQDNQKLKYLLHLCVMDSCKNTNGVIADKMEIIKLLCSEDETIGLPRNPYRHTLEDRLPDGTTPLLQFRVHAKLIQTLIQVGAEINAINDANECMLHTVTAGFSPTEFHDLVESLAETPFNHYCLRDYSFRTPLCCAMRTLDVELKTVKLFLNKGVDVAGQGLLFDAFSRGRSKEFLRELAVGGAYFYHNLDGKSINIPAKVMEAVEYVIEIAPDVLSGYSKKGHKSTNPLEENVTRFIAARVDLHEMKSNQLSSCVLSLHSPSTSDTTEDTADEPYFIVNRLASDREEFNPDPIIHTRAICQMKCWGLAFNYHKIKTNTLLQHVRECTAKVVFLRQELIEEIENSFEQTGKNPIVALEEVGLMDLPQKTQQLILEQKFALQKGDGFPEGTRHAHFSNHSIRGKLLFDLTIEFHVTLLKEEIFMDHSVSWPSFCSGPESGERENPDISTYKIASRRNISSDIFRASAAGKDILVVEGMLGSSQKEFVNGIVMDKSSNQTTSPELTTRYIQLESKEDFGKICALSTSPVHLLSYHDHEGNNNFSWSKSHGSLALIQQHVHKEQQNMMSLATFLEEDLSGQEDNTLICLTYMGGKAVLIESLIEAMKKEIYGKNPTSLVFYREIDAIVIDSIIISSNTTTTAAQNIAGILSNYSVGKEYVINCLQSEDIACHIFLYCLRSSYMGYRQVSTVRNAVYCEKESSLKNTRLYFIVPRSSISVVEKALQTLAFNLVGEEGEEEHRLVLATDFDDDCSTSSPDTTNPLDLFY